MTLSLLHIETTTLMVLSEFHITTSTVMTLSMFHMKRPALMVLMVHIETPRVRVRVWDGIVNVTLARVGHLP